MENVPHDSGQPPPCMHRLRSRRKPVPYGLDFAGDGRLGARRISYRVNGCWISRIGLGSKQAERRLPTHYVRSSLVWQKFDGASLRLQLVLTFTGLVFEKKKDGLSGKLLRAGWPRYSREKHNRLL